MNATIHLSHHDVDQANCHGCLHGFPRKCSCGGHIHAETRMNEESGVSIEYKCDKCDFVFDIEEEEY
ncbi:MAG: hypothetical protein N2484_04630 [Clostridia bacterium]|nr:hypothetical protein [Clostridia bacterium]